MLNDEQNQMISPWHLFKYAEREHILWIVLGTSGAIASSAAIVLFNLMFGYILDLFLNYETDKKNLQIFHANNTEILEQKIESMNDEFMHKMYLYSAFIALSWLSYSLGRFMGLYFMQIFSLKYTAKLKSLFFTSILQQNISWFDQQKAGEYSSRISNDFKKFESGINENFAMILALAISIAFSITYGLYFGWQLALINFISIPFIATGLIVINSYMHRHSKVETEIYAEASCIAEEAISGIRTVKAFSAEDKERERYNSKLKLGFWNAFRRNMFSAMNMAYDWAVLYIFLSIGLYFGIKFMVDGLPGYTFGVVTTISWNCISIGYCLTEMTTYLEAFNLSRSVAAKLFQTIDNKPVVRSGQVQLKPNYEAEIEFRNVSFSYPSRPGVQVLKDFSLKICSGETVALVGASGCGKSTIVQLLQKFYEPTHGDIFLNGVNVHDLQDDWFRAQIGIVGQEPVLFDDSIEKNILLGIKDSDNPPCSIVEASKQANAHRFIQSLPDQYQTFVGESGTQLSGGQKQRIAIARALISNPKILLLDEATSALDVRSEKAVQDALDNASQNRTTLVIAHRLSTIKNVDRIVVIKHGRVVEQGTHEELLQLGEAYYQMFKAQQILSSENASFVTDLKQYSRFDSIQDKDGEYIDSDLIEDSKFQDTGQKAFSYRKVWSLIKQDKLLIEIGVVCALIFGSGTPIYALIYGELLNEINHGENSTLLDRITKYIWQFIGLGFGKFVVCLFQIIIFGYIGEKLTYKLRCMVFDSILEQEIKWFDRKENTSGTICAKISDDAANIQSASGLRISTLLQAFSTLGITIPMGFYFNWQMATFALILMPIVFITFTLSSKLSATQASKESETTKESSKIVVQVINSVRTVMSLNKQQYFFEKFYGNIDQHQRSMVKQALLKSLLYGFSMGMSFAAYGLTFFFSSFLIKSSLVSVADTFRILESMIFGAMAVGQTSILSGDLSKVKHAIASMFELIELKEKQDFEGIIIKNDKDYKSNGNVQFSNVSFSYPTRPNQVILDDLSFSVDQGQTLALVGTSGCGKTTVIQLLEQFYKPDHGEILFDGKSSFGNDWKRKQMSLVSQEPILFNCSIRDNICYGDTTRQISDSEIFQVAQQTNVMEFLSKLPEGLNTNVGQRGTQLSGGQKQRIAIARALIRNPPILLLDEATSALDTESERLVQDALEKASKGRTCIVIAHRLKTIVNSDKIVVIHQGKAVEQGTHEDLIEKRGFYWKLFNLSQL